MAERNPTRALLETARGLQRRKTMLTTLKAISVVVVLGASASVYAQEPGSDTRFKDLDRNGDGFVSRDEGKDAEELHTRFSELDANNDNKLSRDEYAVLEHEARQAAAKKAREPRAAARRSSAAGASR
jgi:hypothetical protein